MREQVLALFGGAYALPGCRASRSLEIHHVLPQAQGGPQETCHRVADHLGLLKITGRAPFDLTFEWMSPPMKPAPLPHELAMIVGDDVPAGTLRGRANRQLDEPGPLRLGCANGADSSGPSSVSSSPPVRTRSHEFSRCDLEGSTLRACRNTIAPFTFARFDPDRLDRDPRRGFASRPERGATSNGMNLGARDPLAIPTEKVPPIVPCPRSSMATPRGRMSSRGQRRRLSDHDPASASRCASCCELSAPRLRHTRSGLLSRIAARTLGRARSDECRRAPTELVPLEFDRSAANLELDRLDQDRLIVILVGGSRLGPREEQHPVG